MMVAPRSVVDVGCGLGGWLAAFARAGVDDVVGIDGDYVNRDEILIPGEKFLVRDLEEPVMLDRVFELALCLEVGEHLSEGASATLVASLTSLAPVVVFSAAIPGQGGIDHVTERWPDYWARLFADHGYLPLDLVRPRIWEDERIEPWYRQNMLVFASGDAYERLAALGRPFAPTSAFVHPEIFEVAIARERLRQPLTLRQLLKELPRAGRAAWYHRLKRFG
jgi:SAM-dependent methyltransferase